MAGLTAEQRATAGVLWEAGRIEPRRERISDGLAAGASLADLTSLASRHGLGPMLWRALERTSPNAARGPALERLRREAELRRAEAQLLLPHAVALAVRPLQARGLEPVIFKGPAVAARYPEPGLRSMVDIDLLLPKGDHSAAVHALEQAGWTVARRAHRRCYETRLVHPSVPGLFVELHLGLDGWNEQSNKIGLADLWRSRGAIECCGSEAFGLPVEVEIVALAAHAGKPHHCFSRLIWAVDLVVVDDAARRSGVPVDWDRVSTLAQNWRCQTVLAVSLIQATRLGLECPADLKRLRGSGVRVSALQPLIEPGWPLSGPDRSMRHRLRYALCDTWSRRLVLFAGYPVEAPVRDWPSQYAGVIGAILPAARQLLGHRDDSHGGSTIAIDGDRADPGRGPLPFVRE